MLWFFFFFVFDLLSLNFKDFQPLPDITKHMNIIMRGLNFQEEVFGVPLNLERDIVEWFVTPHGV